MIVILPHISVIQAFDASHARWNTLLKTHTHDGLVDYEAIQNDPSQLQAYLNTLAKVRFDEFEQWDLEIQLAFLINLYNAATIDLILDAYPINSIKDIGILPHAAWRKKFVSLWGKDVSLNHLEHEQIRPRAKQHPEIHFALVCAAKGCPPLRKEAYTGEHLDAQLKQQGRNFLLNPVKNSVNNSSKTLHLSPVFDWYASDFEYSHGSVPNYLCSTYPDVFPLEARHYRIEYTSYDWSLNVRTRK